MSILIGYIILLVCAFSFAAGLYFGLSAIRLI